MRKALWLTPVVLLLALALAAVWLLYTEAGLHWAHSQVKTRLPGTLTIESLTGRLAGPLTIRQLRYVDDDTTVSIDQLMIDWAPLALLRGHLKITQLSLGEIQLAVGESKKPKDEHGDFTLPLSVSVEQAALQRFTFQKSAGAPFAVTSAELAGRIDNDRIVIDDLTIVADTFELKAQGALGLRDGDDRLTTSWRVAVPSFGTLVGNGTVSGNLNALSLSQQLTEPLAASLSGRVENALHLPTWQLTATAPETALRQLNANAPDAKLAATLHANGDMQHFQGSGAVSAHVNGLPRIQAEFQAKGDTSGNVTLNALQLSVPGSQARVNATATLRADKTWKTQLKWQAMTWPLTGAATVTSASGSLNAEGSLTTYELDTNFVLGGPTIPTMHWQAQGTGNASELRLTQIALNAMNGNANGNALVRWSPQLQWTASLDGTDFNPGAIWPDWPGALSLRARANGDTQRQRIEIDRLAGSLRGYPLQATFTGARRGDNFSDLALSLTSGDLRANAHGNIGSTWNVAWDLQAPSLAAAFPGASGQLSSTGKISGKRATPTLQAQVSAANAAYDALRVGQLRLNANIDLSDSARSNLETRVDRAIWNQHAFDSITLSASGYLHDHTLETAASASGLMFSARFGGRYANQAWDGSVLHSAWKINKEDWQLEQRAPLRVARERIELGQTCWRAPSSARVCAAVTQQQTTVLSLLTDRVPLALLTPLLPDALTLNGTVTGKLDAQRSANGVLNAEGRFDFSPGDITLSGPTATTLTYQRGEINLHANADGLQASAMVLLTNNDRLQANVSLPEFNRTANSAGQPITGRATLTLTDLAPLAAIFPELAELKGSLNGDLTIGGTVDDPAVQGSAELKNGGARLPGIGIRLEDVRLTLASAGRQSLRLTGSARSGDGELGLSGQLSFSRGFAWRAEARVAGARFLAMDVPEAKVYVTPDLRAQMSPGQINLKGDLHIPEAQFKPRVRRESIAAISRDVVIVNGQEASNDETQTPWKVTAEIRVSLGERVSIEGYGLNAHVNGELVLLDTPTQVTTGRGELRVTRGDYEAYGEKLALERGRLLFLGGPVTNPGIDARAVRRVDTITAGVEVKGTLQSPQLSLFSDPPMGQADALSYLLFGKPLEGADAAQGRSLAGAARALRLAGGEQLAQRLGARFGIEEVEIESTSGAEQAALVLGKRLSPRLYINYSIGLFEQSNVFRIRYQLSKSWSVEAQSGTTTTGGDLLYTIER